MWSPSFYVWPEYRSYCKPGIVFSTYELSKRQTRHNEASSIFVVDESSFVFFAVGLRGSTWSNCGNFTCGCLTRRFPRILALRCSIEPHRMHRERFSQFHLLELGMRFAVNVFLQVNTYLESAKRVIMPGQCMHRRLLARSPKRSPTMTDAQLESLNTQFLQLGPIVHLSTK